MCKIILFDEPTTRTQLLPFTFTRPIAAIRCGILTIAEKWELWLGKSVSFATEAYLSGKFPFAKADEYLYINGALCPDVEVTEAICKLTTGQGIVSKEGYILAFKSRSIVSDFGGLPNDIESVTYDTDFTIIQHVWNIFGKNGSQLLLDFTKVTEGRTSQKLNDPYTYIYNPANVFIEEGADIKAAILNAENGPIYIGKNATIQEGAMIQGPFAIGEGSTVAQGAKIRPNTSVGPYCKVGGEVSNSVIFGYSNKGHDGYLGNSVLGEWCNLGANTNNSNLKNDHTNVKLYNFAVNDFTDTGIVNCGLMMGDYSKAGISTMFNTGTVVGVNVNVFGGGFQPKYIPSFSWGGQQEGFTEYRFAKAAAVADDTLRRRNRIFDQEESNILNEVFERTKTHRTSY